MEGERFGLHGFLIVIDLADQVDKGVCDHVWQMADCSRGKIMGFVIEYQWDCSQ